MGQRAIHCKDPRSSDLIVDALPGGDIYVVAL